MPKNFWSARFKILEIFCDAKTFSRDGPLEIFLAFSNSSAAAPSAVSGAPVGARQTGRQQVSGAPDHHVAQVEDMAMRTFDPTPFWRSTVGFDRLFDMLDQTSNLHANDSYPPYNIERSDEDHYRISLALAGFSPDEVTITAEQNVLTVEGAKAQKANVEYLYQGISARPSRR